MKRSLVLLSLPVLVLACDMKDQSLGDTGADGDSAGDQDTAGDEPTATGPDSGDSGQDSGDSGVDCTAIGCDSGITLTLTGEVVDGAYTVRMYDGDTREQLQECAFDKSGEIGANPCRAHVLGDEIQLLLDVAEDSIAVDVTIDGASVASLEAAPQYVVLQPNGPMCEPTCTQASLTAALSAPTVDCDTLEEQFAAEVEAVRGCVSAEECGQVIEGFSCGCTRDWVGRLDADLTSLYALSNAATDSSCQWAGWGSVCDCPAVDGFACVDDTCTWNYL